MSAAPAQVYWTNGQMRFQERYLNLLKGYNNSDYLLQPKLQNSLWRTCCDPSANNTISHFSFTRRDYRIFAFTVLHCFLVKEWVQRRQCCFVFTQVFSSFCHASIPIRKLISERCLSTFRHRRYSNIFVFIYFFPFVFKKNSWL